MPLTGYAHCAIYPLPARSRYISHEFNTSNIRKSFPMPSAVLTQASPVLPIFDLSNFTEGESKQRKDTAIQVVEAFKTYGFVYFVNHGITEGKIDELFSWSRRFFALPEEVRMSPFVLRPKPASTSEKHHIHLRGYTPTGYEKLTQNMDQSLLETLRAVPDVKDMFEMGPNKGPAVLREPNRYPPQDILPGFEEFTQNFFWEAHELAMNIFRCIAIGLGLDENYFVDYHADADNLFRLIRYPPVDRQQMLAGTKARTSPHTDFGSITIFFQDDVGGLEVENPSHPGTYVQATPVKGSVIVNIADFLMRWTNDVLKSNLHRVVAPPVDDEREDGRDMTKERYSIPFFVQADRQKMVECAPGMEGEGKKYEPISPAEYLHRRVTAVLKDA